MHISKLVTRPPFSTLFPIDPRVLAAIKEDMETNGYDLSKPIDIWTGDNVVLDGHTRLQAATQAGVQDVPTHVHTFDDEDAALEYTIHNQRDRRNMTDADIIRCVMALDRRKMERGGGDRRSAGSIVSKAPTGAFDNQSAKSAEATARIIGASPRTVERTRTVLDHADDPTRQAVLDGQKSINQAYNETQERRKAETEQRRATFNRTNDNIKWALWTWNPVTGCKHGCAYCYARDIANRFNGTFEPTYHPERLFAPQNTRVPAAATDNPAERNVFVCSMADLFGEWVPQDWIDAVLAAVQRSPQWTYLFLTKNPRRMVGIDWPKNTRVGATVDTQARVRPTEEAFRQVNAPFKFVSLEPLTERVWFSRPDLFNLFIVGARSASSGMLAMQPQWQWVEDLWVQARSVNAALYFKENLTAKPQEFPRDW